jgi:hypothetical protein
MTHREIINKVFNQYFHSDYIPSAHGAFPSSNMVQLLASLSVVHQKILDEANIDKVWYNDDTVTWYTPQLHKLIKLPRFSDDSDQDFLDRIQSFHVAQELGGQSEGSIRTVLVELMKEAIQDSDIAFIFTQDTADPWDGSEFWDSTATWQDLLTVLDVNFLVSIRFTRSGFPTDEYAWEYWSQPQHFTKIDDLILLFKPVGSTFKIQLVAPTAFRRYFFSTGRIKNLANEFTQTSSTTMKVFGYGDTMTPSQTALFKAGYFYGDLEFLQTISLGSITNVEASGVEFPVAFTKLYGSFTTII